MSNNLIEIEWNGFASAAVPSDASSVQKKETRLAFWAGAVSMFGIVNKAAEKEEAEAEMVLQSVEQEIMNFRESLFEELESAALKIQTALKSRKAQDGSPSN